MRCAGCTRPARHALEHRARRTQRHVRLFRPARRRRARARAHRPRPLHRRGIRDPREPWLRQLRRGAGTRAIIAMRCGDAPPPAGRFRAGPTKARSSRRWPRAIVASRDADARPRLTRRASAATDTTWRPGRIGSDLPTLAHRDARAFALGAGVPTPATSDDAARPKPHTLVPVAVAIRADARRPRLAARRPARPRRNLRCREARAQCCASRHYRTAAGRRQVTARATSFRRPSRSTATRSRFGRDRRDASAHARNSRSRTAWFERMRARQGAWRSGDGARARDQPRWRGSRWCSRTATGGLQPCAKATRSRRLTGPGKRSRLGASLPHAVRRAAGTISGGRRA